MQQLLLVGHILVCIFLVMLVLVQQGKGATMGASFGAGASQTVFGSQGSGSFLFKLTAFVAALFFATSLTLGYYAMQQGKSQSNKAVLPGVVHPVQAPVKKEAAQPAAGQEQFGPAASAEAQAAGAPNDTAAPSASTDSDK
jgi:preprotein translocase subunit SecG